MRFLNHQLTSRQNSQPGIDGESREVVLNLKLIADIGLVGLPNAGKSTLLSKLTNAKPKIANYPFTTLIPNLGVLELKNGHIYKIADIPGIIEGAHKGHGLGLSFLQHIERVKVILFVIDITGNDLGYTLELLRSELKTYNTDLVNRPFYIVLTKTDMIEKEEIEEIISIFKENVIAISSVSDENLDELIDIIDRLLEKYIAEKRTD